MGQPHGLDGFAYNVSVNVTQVSGNSCMGMTSEGAERLLAEGGMVEIRAEAGEEAGQACLTLLRVLGVEAHLAGPEEGEHAIGLRLLAPEGLVWLRDHWPTADHIVLLPVYGAREQPMAGIDSHLIADLLTAQGVSSELVSTPAQAVAALADAAAPGDLILTIGAGDVTALGPLLLRALARRAGTDHN